MGQRSRKRRPASAESAHGARRGKEARDDAAGGAGDAPNASMKRGYARSRERDDAVRARLEPFAPGERPLAIKICAALAAAIAVANLLLFLAGWEVQGQDPKIGGTLALCAVLLAAAVGMWRMKYWAVLGFEVLLGVLVVSAALSLMLASNLQAALLSLAIVVLAGPLFWLLIRVMARIQLPQRHPRA